MVNSGLFGKMEEKMAICGKKCEESKGDAFFSIIYASELETWQALYKRLQGSVQADAGILQTELRERLARLEEAKGREEERPSFDWYDEHYHYKVLEGQCAAYQGMLELMENGERRDHAELE